jgi:hypothetical protein
LNVARRHLAFDSSFGLLSFSKAISSVREYTQSRDSAFVLFILWTQLPAQRILPRRKPEMRRNGEENTALSVHQFTEIK